MEEDKNFGVYMGKRDDSFKQLILNILGDMDEKYKKTLTSGLAMSYFSTAFTHPSADSQNNYNFLRALGHVSFQKNVVWYLSRKKVVVVEKSKLDKTITDYKIRLIKSLGKIMVENLFDYISIDKKSKSQLIESGNEVIQSVFEALFSAVELVLDREYTIGTGNLFVYNCINTLFDKYIELEESIEKDPKTTLNEIFISNKKILGVPEYEEVECKDGIYTIDLYQVLPNKRRVLIGRGIDKPKKQAEKNAAKQVLDRKQVYSLTYTGEIKPFNI